MWATPDPLRALLGKKLAEAKAKALAGELAKEDVDAADRLAKLAAMQDAQARFRPSRLMIYLFVFVLLAVVWFMFSELGTTGIELDATANALTFHLPGPAPLTRNWVLSSAGVLGYAEGSFDEGEPDVIPAGPGTVLLEALPDPKNAGSLTLAGIETAGPATVAMEPRPEGEYRFHIHSPGTKLKFTAHGRVRLNRAREFRFTGAPKDFVFTLGETPVDLDLGLGLEKEPDLHMQLPVDRLALARVEQYGAGERQVSAILSGSLLFEELNGQEYKLRPAEGIRIELGTKGTLRTASLLPGKIALRYNGQIHGVWTSAGPDERSLMPNWFEYLRARQPVWLLLGAIMAAWGLAQPLLKWMRLEL